MTSNGEKLLRWLADARQRREAADREEVRTRPPWVVFDRGDGTADVLPAGRPGSIIERIPLAQACEMVARVNRDRAG